MTQDDAKDAARYRWLKLGNTREMALRVVWNDAIEIAVNKCGDDWDRLIDEARARNKVLSAADGNVL